MVCLSLNSVRFIKQNCYCQSVIRPYDIDLKRLANALTLFQVVGQLEKRPDGLMISAVYC